MLSSLDSRDNESPGAIGFGHVDSDTQVDVRRVDGNGFPVHFVVVNVLTGQFLEGFDHGPGDEVSERNLPTSSTPKMVVDDNAVVDHQLRRHGANAGSRGHTEALVHVGSECFGHSLQRIDLIRGRFLGCVIDRRNNRGRRGGRFGGNGLLFGRNRRGLCDGGGHRGGVIRDRNGWRRCSLLRQRNSGFGCARFEEGPPALLDQLGVFLIQRP